MEKRCCDVSAAFVHNTRSYESMSYECSVRDPMLVIHVIVKAISRIELTSSACRLRINGVAVLKINISVGPGNACVGTRDYRCLPCVIWRATLKVSRTSASHAFTPSVLSTT
jgi:hypothetical protein